MTTEQNIIYLDNAATTFPKPEAVYQAMDSFYRKYGGNAGRGANPLARKAAYQRWRTTLRKACRRAVERGEHWCRLSGSTWIMYAPYARRRWKKQERVS